MADIKLITTVTGEYTIGFENGDFILDQGFETSILLSLLLDARATDDRVLVPENRRGWMGDVASKVDGRTFGSLLWLVDQRVLNTETLNDSINFAQLANNWFLEDGVAKAIAVTGSIIPSAGIRLEIAITSDSGNTTNHYVNLWEVTGVT